MNKLSSSQEFFEAKYQQTADPWDFATSEYEGGRYDAIIRTLDDRRYRRAFEPGCSIGVLTERLARQCDKVEATDISPTAVSRARERCRFLENVTIERGRLPDAIPAGVFDLIVFSEIGYYFSPEELAGLAETLVSRMTKGGTFLAEHWLGISPDHHLTGDEVHNILQETPGLAPTGAARYEGFRIDRWTRID